MDIFHNKFVNKQQYKIYDFQGEIMNKKLKYLGMASLLFLTLSFQTPAYAAPDAPGFDTTVDESEYFEENNPEFSNEEEAETDEFGLSDEDKEEEFGEEGALEGEPEEDDTNNETIITLNFNVRFDFDIKEKPVFLVQVDIPLGLENSEGEESHELINLTDRENFFKSYTMNIYSDLIEMIGHVDGDNAMLYNIEFENIEKNDFFGNEIRNSGVIKNVSNGQAYDVTLIVTENPDAKIKDANDVTLSDGYKKIVSGEYGESRAVELESSETHEPELEINLENPDDPAKAHRNLIPIFIIGIGIILISAGGYIFIKKIREEDDE